MPSEGGAGGGGGLEEGAGGGSYLRRACPDGKIRRLVVEAIFQAELAGFLASFP